MRRPNRLWRERDFVAFWIGETASQVGTQVTFVALPLVALLSLGASASEVGVLRFAEYLPFLLCTLPFGVWADRRRRRGLMMASYAVRALLVGLIPVLAVLGLLHFSTLVAIAFTVGIGAALFEVCWLSYVPSLVEPDRLVEAMGKVATSHSVAEVAGPGVGGLLVQLFTAPYAVALDSVSYVAGVVSLARIRRREPEPVRSKADVRALVAELVQGLRFAFREPHIRATAYAAAMGNFFALITETAFLLYAVRELRFSPGIVGFVFTAIGAGGLLGAVLANTLTRRWRLGQVYLGVRVVGCLAAFLMPLAGGPKATAVLASMTSFFVVQAALANVNVINASLRQALTPDTLRGRMNASVRTLVYGTLPLGGLAAGLLGDTVGLRGALWVGAVGYAMSLVPIVLSPIPRLTTIPTALQGRHTPAL